MTFAIAPQIQHGGTDAGPVPAHDFSSNANPLGPPPLLLAAVMAADRERYPDPHYTALRERLGLAWGVSADRVLPCAGGAEAIRRLSLATLLAGGRAVWVPQPGFGDYAAAAQALGLEVLRYQSVAELCRGLRRDTLAWVCDPCNPTGTAFSPQDWLDLTLALQSSGATLAIDQAYEPLRLNGQGALPPVLAERAWRLQCPNKALGLTGVRAAALLAPAGEDSLREHAEAVAPSWVLAAEACALLQHWVSSETQTHLRRNKLTLQQWQLTQHAGLQDLGWQQGASCCNFWLARPPQALDLPALRALGIRVRDAGSFGLPGWIRLSIQPPQAQLAFFNALKALRRP
ncbi:aminotransferase class I/II-fold pyridoxal phosphate-dependent enzyme [Roseateles koreensis]|uniref:histidinol-phosphate transaminase n=1 Tax=Roseateles koreensis TaxID=2987526 RepID=A0ABT5KSJ2_9BURK|nr:aminotransferase class I/II-fold pyridoxal phosphate-dependent enzyme [Roseateles koreensis]MDC8785791.1 aminotransferase class I/II-fold pyridoxal phosphate-dependent enzyme [Roseateles koreensis]